MEPGDKWMMVQGHHLSGGTVVQGDSCPGGTVVLGGQLSRGTNDEGTNVGRTLVSGRNVTTPAQLSIGPPQELSKHG